MTTLAVVSDGKSERDKAIELRDAVRERLLAIIALQDEARKDGLRIEFNLVIDPFGRHQIGHLAITKVMA